MEVDVGLKSGVKFLWEKDMFLDFTVKAGGEDFQVHKLVLASVSDYFRTMLKGDMAESRKDEVEVTQFSAQRMSRLIEFIYTGSLGILEDYPKDILECAMYFQMPKVIEECISVLLHPLSLQNCLDLLSTFEALSLTDPAAKVMTFISRNAAEVMKRYKPHDMTASVIQVMLNNWKTTDWDMVNYLTTWFSADFENRKEHLNEFMGRVKFSLLTADEIEAVKDMDVYKESQGAWKDLVDTVSPYDQLPIYKKVLVDSGIRTNKALYLMDTNPDPKSGGTAYVLDKSNNWRSCGKYKLPDVSGTMPFVVEVNNFLITCSEFGEKQTWQIFEPCNLSWSKIANMPTPRDEFAMVYHDKFLYVLGGTQESALTDTVMMYSFETNTWSCTNIKLPVPIKNHAACVLNGGIYVSGGEIPTDNGTCVSNRLDYLDLTSKTWTSLAPMSTPQMQHNMCSMKTKTQAVVVVIERDISISYYTPSTNKWSTSAFTVDFAEQYDDDACRRSQDHRWVPGRSKMLAHGNNLYLLGLDGKELKDGEKLKAADDSSDSVEWPFGDTEEEPEYEETNSICVRFKVIFQKHRIDTCTLDSFPIRTGPYPSKATIAGLFAIPGHGE